MLIKCSARITRDSVAACSRVQLTTQRSNKSQTGRDRDYYPIELMHLYAELNNYQVEEQKNGLIEQSL